MRRLNVIALVILFATIGARESMAQPTSMSYQGHLLSNGAPFDGQAQFKFAIYDEDENLIIWSNDGTGIGGGLGQPASFVTVPVTQGVFGVRLGAPPMVPLTSELLNAFDITFNTLFLKAWVNTGSSFEELPGQPLSSSAFALHSETAEKSLGQFSANGIIHSQQGGFRFPDNTVQTTAATGGGGGGTLDQAYDFGGPGAGRTITADAGAVNIQGPNGLTVNGKVGIGTAAPRGRLGIQNVGANDTTRLISFDEAEGDLFFFESGFSPTGGLNNLKLRNNFNTRGMTWRVDGRVGINTTNFPGTLSIANSSGTNEPTLDLDQNDAGGSALHADASGPVPTMLLENHGGGPFIKCIVGPNPASRFEVTQAGQVRAPFLEVNGGGPFQLDSNGHLDVVGLFGNGVSGVPVYVENQSSAGIAIWGKTVGADATQVLEQNGSGDLIRGFQNGQLKFRVLNTGRVMTPVLEITGGADLAEPFAMSDGETARPGSVLVIDEEKPGSLKLCRSAYDRRVAGIVSGAGGIDPGITLNKDGMVTGGRNVALSGRVYALAETGNGPIEPGDLLTTSEVEGHAMKATDHGRTSGAVIGKAMSRLESGRGLVLVLVSLQ
jgi:hypothetical protein